MNTVTFFGDFGVTQYDINKGQFVYLLAFLLMEILSGLLSKWMRPEHWVPIQIFVWSMVGVVQSMIKTRLAFTLFEHYWEWRKGDLLLTCVFT